MSRTFEFIALTLSFSPSAAIAIAASRADATGVLDLEHVADAEAAAAAMAMLAKHGRGRLGVKLDGRRPAFARSVLDRCPRELTTLILTAGSPADLAVLRHSGGHMRVLLEITSADELEAADALRPDGIVAKGHEAAGWVGDETAFILLQHLGRLSAAPVWIHGGIGPCTAAGCRAAGAAGVVLDAQLALTRESPLDADVRAAIGRMDGSETVCLSVEPSSQFRVFSRPGARALDDVRRLAADSMSGVERREAIRSRVGPGSLDAHIWPLGQDAAFARGLADRYQTVGGVIGAFRDAVAEHTNTAATLKPLRPEAPLAKAHRTRYPLVQGPMTRVSDGPEFARAVADSGALPFLALALMRAAEVERVLLDTQRLLGNRPWGVGILGFVPPELRDEQIAVICRHRPPFALIAGGRPEQARVLESAGIPTYLHVPSPGLLRVFLPSGARRFVFEGRECGGHVGPRSSFVLWQSMVDALLESLSSEDLATCHVLFAGGVHDAVSAAVVSAIGAPLVAAGARIGALLGTAYLFTDEAVATGAITPTFQQEALRCRRTVLLETGPGHAIRCADTPYAAFFAQEKQRLADGGESSERVRDALESINLGRLRIASKGLARNPALDRDPGAPRLLTIDAQAQQQQGMFMLGQLAALHGRTCSMAALHETVSAGSATLLSALHSPVAPPSVAAAPRQVCDIAIVGMGCLLPKAPDLQRYWENLLGRVDAITEVPPERWDPARLFDANPKAVDRVVSRWGGFLDDVPFDPMAYGMPPAGLRSIEPLQLLTLEVVRQAIEDAGYARRPMPRQRTAVILGAGGGIADLGQQYAFRAALPLFFDHVDPALLDRLPAWTEDSFPGVLVNVAAGRVANRFDFGGPNFTVDAACASSLAALQLGVRELETGTSDVVIVGAADTLQNAFSFMCFSKTQALSPTGRCRPFDESADGIAISEGLAAVVLKRLADAERDGDRIYAVIKGVGGASDGRGRGLTAPRVEGQVLALERAYAAAGVSPDSVGLIEAHGTGTVAGDQAEIESLHRVFGGAGARRRSCAIGSVKSMIGHTKCTAGLAGLLKVALALHHRVLPPTIGVTRPNAKAGFAESPFFVNADPAPWCHTSDQPRRAGVSAFGFGGTNFHAVLEEYTGDYLPDARRLPVSRWPAELCVWHGTRSELQRHIGTLAGMLAAGARPELRDLAFSLSLDFSGQRSASRAEGAFSVAVVATSLDDLREKLQVCEEALRPGAAGRLNDPRGIYFSDRGVARGGKVAVLFPGQGSQYPHMMRDLVLAFPRLRENVESASRALADWFDRPLDRYIFPPPWFTDGEERQAVADLTRTDVAQPALGTVGLCAFNLLERLGVRADFLGGHSYGEYVALCAAGVFDVPTLLELSAARGQFMSEAAGAEPGTMAAVEAPHERVRQLLSASDRAWIANVNSPSQTIISGTTAGVRAAADRMRAHGLHVAPLPVACAFHSPVVADARDRLAARLRDVIFRPPARVVFSNTQASPYPSDPREAAALLADHLTSPVNFQGEIEAMFDGGARVFIEAGPKSVLTNLVRQTLGDRPHLAVAIDAQGRHGLIQLVHALGRLVAEGAPLTLDHLFEHRGCRQHSLTTLLEETRERPLPATTWLVSGGHVRPAGEPVRVLEPRWNATDHRAATPAASPGTRADAAGVPVLQEFHALMDRVLEAQRSVMLAYLNGGAAAVSPAVVQPAVPEPVIAPTSEQVVAATTEDVREAAASDGDTLRRTLVDIVSARTGYPPEMLGLDANLEADLGIDSIKRVEIVASMQQACALDASGAGDRLSGARTLRDILAALAPRDSAPASPPLVYPSPPASSPQPENAAGEECPRLGFVEVEVPAPVKLVAHSSAYLVTDDGGGVADALKGRLRALGGKAFVVGPKQTPNGPDLIADTTTSASAVEVLQRARAHVGPLAGVIHLLPLAESARGEELDPAGWRTRLDADVKSLFVLAKAVRRELASPVVVAATRAGVEGRATFSLGSGAVAGLIKTLAVELPEANCKAVDFTVDVPPDAIADRLLAEIASADGEPVVSYRGRSRLVQRAEKRAYGPPGRSPLVLDRSSIVLATGGARGITAEIAAEIALRYQSTLLLAGRSPLPDRGESQATAGLVEPRALKAALAAVLREEGQSPSLAQIEATYRRLLKAREISSNLQRMRNAGAHVQYTQVDVGDPAAFSAYLRETYRQYGRIDAVVHGAGTIEDKLFCDKSDESFARVFHTKATSALVLWQELQPETLKVLMLFSSVAGAFGSRGQCDYTAANGLLNTLAQRLDREWSARVVAINWGPWAGAGMVSPEVQRQFTARGIRLLEPALGRRAFDDELRLGRKGEPEVILGWGPGEVFLSPVADSPVEAAL